MSQNRFVRHGPARHPEPRFGRLLLVSLGLHLVVVAFSFFDILPHSQPPQQQTYYVDLVNMPVKSPQAGRPDAAPEEKKAPEPEPAPEKPAVQKSEPASETVVRKKEPVKKEPAKKEPAEPDKPEPEPAVAEKPEPKPEPKPDRYKETRSAIEKMKQKREREAEIEAMKKEIASLSDTRRSDSVRGDVGMPEGTGTEAGPSYEAYLHDYLKENWSLSQYQASSLDLEAKIELTYDAEGNLLDYRFKKESADSAFNDSLKKAIHKANPLDFKPPEERWVVSVTFNLKDLRD
ncbi:MAG: TonB C-terminal domain-containing protein [Desulfuromonadales bacterium]